MANGELKTSQEDLGRIGSDGIASDSTQAFKMATALTQRRALTQQLMEKICDKTNLNQAYRRVKANRGAAGIDGMTTDELYQWLSAHKESLIASLLNGRYRPSPIRRVDIPVGLSGCLRVGQIRRP